MPRAESLHIIHWAHDVGTTLALIIRRNNVVCSVGKLHDDVCVVVTHSRTAFVTSYPCQFVILKRVLSICRNRNKHFNGINSSVHQV